MTERANLTAEQKDAIAQLKLAASVVARTFRPYLWERWQDRSDLDVINWAAYLARGVS